MNAIVARLEERVVLVDRDGRDALDASGAVRTLGKLEAHRVGARHRAISAFVFDGERLLLQRRAEGKYHSSGLWTNTCCTHPRPGESPLAAARRRLREEMGVECDLVELFRLAYFVELGERLFEHEYDHVFVGRWRGTPQVDPAEVAEWRWIDERALLAELATRPDDFTWWMRCCLAEVLRRRPRDGAPP